MVMFLGEYRHNIDSKNRLIVPSKFRDQLTSNVYITEWMDGCLAAFAEEQWMEMMAKLNKLPKTNAAARAYVRRIAGKADQCPIDNQGRILLPQFQINDLGFQKACVLVGESDHFVIWPAEKFDAIDISEEDFNELAESLTDLMI